VVVAGHGGPDLLHRAAAVAGLTFCIELRPWQGWLWLWLAVVVACCGGPGETRGWWRRATCCIEEAAMTLVKEEKAVAVVLIEEVRGRVAIKTELGANGDE
jgi:hypothetical protein